MTREFVILPEFEKCWNNIGVIFKKECDTMKVYDSIIRGLNEAVNYEKGNLKHVKTHTVRITPLTLYK